MPARFSNRAVSTLAVQCDVGHLTATVRSGDGALFYSPGVSEYQVLVLRNADWTAVEYIHCTSRSGDVLTIERQKEGTAEQNWPVDTIIEGIITAAILDNFGQVEALGLTQLSDVDLVSPATGETLQYDGFEWTNAHGRELGIRINSALPGQSDLGDVSLTALADNHVLSFNNGSALWENKLLQLDQNNDVTLTSVQSGQILEYNGSQWVNVVNPGDGGGSTVAFYARFRDESPGSNQAIGAADVWQQIQTQSYEAYEYLNVQEPSGGTGYDVTVQATVGPAYRTLLSATVLIQISTAGQRVDIDYGRNGSRLHTARAFVSCSEPGIHQLTLPTIEIHTGAGNDVFSLFIKSNLTNSVIIGENMYYVRGMA